MRIALIGATGRTGKHALAAALEQGHDVTVLVRDPTKLPTSAAARIRVIVGDTSSREDLRKLLTSADVIISALGPTGNQPYLHTRTAIALVPLMVAGGPKRFIGVSCGHVNRFGDEKRFINKVIDALFRRFNRTEAADKSGEFPIWSFSKLNWTLARPHRLVDEPASGRRLGHHPHQPPRNTTIARADLGAFLIEIADKNLYSREAPFVANG
ncbi:NAD(P)-dependent oxidoreductase [Arthrobacter sp. Sr33]